MVLIWEEAMTKLTGFGTFAAYIEAERVRGLAVDHQLWSLRPSKGV
jgi:hypothetical protein